MRLTLCIVFILLALAGCGRKGALMPPEALVPAEVQDLKVQQSGDAFRITWSAPAKEKGGRPLRDLAGFRLFRRIIAGDGSDCAACADTWSLLAAVDAENPGEQGRSGSTFISFDSGIPAGQTRQFRLQALSKSGGVSSAAVSPLVKYQPPIAAPAVTALALPASIRLDFTAQTEGTARPAGFNIYRRTDAGALPLLPYNQAPLQGGGWEDNQLAYDHRYSYSVTTLVETPGGTVESFRSAEISLPFSRQELR